MPTKRQLQLMRESQVEYFPLKVFNENTEAITEAAHFANTMLSEVCHNEETSKSGVIPAASSETWLVEQNLDKLKPEE